MSRVWLGLCALFSTLTFDVAAVAQHVAPTEPLTPQEQQAKFHVPEGFSIQLVASEPDIGQPMNLDFDARGRLWVTHSVEYPFPARGEGVEPRSDRFAGTGDHEPRDRLTILSSFAGNGKAQSVVHFADGLNIPIGHVPLSDGSQGMVYSIPSIYHLDDRDGDGRSDSKEPVYGKFGNRDTHGMASSFTRWIDGWIYGCHGFSNHSSITDASGRVTKMESGNCYRFRANGSRFELFTTGQVNPFGLTIDPFGQIYSADCHTKPITMLLRGADYPHFSKQAKPIGFGPEMIDHSHGSTGICGPAYYSGVHFPPDFRENLFLCNPVTGKVHRDKLRHIGSTMVVESQPDFVTCDDPWFRPVDAIMGPDGALYIADFYNAIIGHYEVDLEHPKRDRERGRIWRVIYVGQGQGPPRTIDLVEKSNAELLDALESENLLLRTLATNWYIDKFSKSDPANAASALRHKDARVRAHAAWIVERIAGLTDAQTQTLAQDTSPLVRVHMHRVLGERTDWNETAWELARTGLEDTDPRVRRASASNLQNKPKTKNVLPLLRCWSEAAAEDTHLIHVIRMTLLRHVEDPQTLDEIIRQSWSNAQQRRLIEIASASEKDTATKLLVRYLNEVESLDRETLTRIIPPLTRLGTNEAVSQLVRLARGVSQQDPAKALEWVDLISAALETHGHDASQHKPLLRWGETLLATAIEDLRSQPVDWLHVPHPDFPESESPWGLKERESADGQKTKMLDSIVHGEARTGIYRSKSFPLPERLTFWLCGHNGEPSKTDSQANHIRMILDRNGMQLARSEVPRNDKAQKQVWNLTPWAGKQGHIEIVDANNAASYAWIAAGRFSPDVVRIPETLTTDPSALRPIQLVERLKRRELLDSVREIVDAPQRDSKLRLAAAECLLSLDDSADSVGRVASILADAVSHQVRAEAARLLVQSENPKGLNAVADEAVVASASSQLDLAKGLCSTTEGSTRTLGLLRSGKVSSRLLRDAKIKSQLLLVAKGADKRWLESRAKETFSQSPDVSERLQKFAATYAETVPSVESGKRLFGRHCATCHRLGDKGKQVGPQLDGIGIRSPTRIAEDILDPNRNVDEAFRTVTIETRSGKVLSGMKASGNDQALRFINNQGEEFRLDEGDIEQMQTSRLSLMPANFGSILSETDLTHIVQFLAQQPSSGTSE